MKANQAQLLVVAFVSGILVCEGFKVFWTTVPYPGQLLVVLFMLAVPAAGMLLWFRALTSESFTSFGRMAFGVLCVMSLVPLSGVVVMVLRAAFGDS